MTPEEFIRRARRGATRSTSPGPPSSTASRPTCSAAWWRRSPGKTPRRLPGGAPVPAAPHGRQRLLRCGPDTDRPARRASRRGPGAAATQPIGDDRRVTAAGQRLGRRRRAGHGGGLHPLRRRCSPMAAQLDGARILSPETVRLMTADHMVGHSAAGAGRAPWARRATASASASRCDWQDGVAGRARATPASTCGPATAARYFWVDPKAELVGVYMTAAPSRGARRVSAADPAARALGDRRVSGGSGGAEARRRHRVVRATRRDRVARRLAFRRARPPARTTGRRRAPGPGTARSSAAAAGERPPQHAQPRRHGRA